MGAPPEGCRGDGEGSLDNGGERAAGLNCPPSDALLGAGAGTGAEGSGVP